MTKGVSGRERVLLSLVAAAVIATVFYLFYYTPKTAERQRLETELKAKQTQLAQLQQLADTREEKEREYQALVDRIRLVEAKLPPEREIPDLIRELQDVASSLGIKLTLLRPGPTQPGPTASRPEVPAPVAAPAGLRTALAAPATPGAPAAAPRTRYNQFRLDLAFEGTYGDLMAFMGRLEDFPRFLVLTQLSITPVELPRLKVTLAANTFVLPRGAQTPP